MLLSNNIAGPTVSLMPGLAQEAGWLAMVSSMLVLCALTMACSYGVILGMVYNSHGQRLGKASLHRNTNVVGSHFVHPISALTQCD